VLVSLLLLGGARLLADLINLASRSVTEAGDGALIAGFGGGGATGEQVLVRAVVPTLADFGVVGALSRVQLELVAGEMRLASNEGGDTGADPLDIAKTAQRVGAFPFPDGS